MVIDLIVKTCIASAIRAWHGTNVHCLPIWKDNALPSDEDARLTICDLTGVPTHKACALRDQFPLTGRCVEYVLADLGHDLTRQARIDARNQRSGHDKAGAQFIGTTRCLRFCIELPSVFLSRVGKLRIVSAARCAGAGCLQEPGCGGTFAAWHAPCPSGLELLETRFVACAGVVAGLCVDLLSNCGKPG